MYMLFNPILLSLFNLCFTKHVYNSSLPIDIRILNKNEQSNNTIINKRNNNEKLIAKGRIENCVGPGMVSLTFDDGPSVHTNFLLDKLNEKQVKATFFVNGNKFDDRMLSETTVRAYREGHDIGSHGYSHLDLVSLDQVSLEREIDMNSDAIFKLINRKPAYFRIPYFSSNDNIIKMLNNKGYEVLFVNLDTKDYETHSTNPRKIYDVVESALFYVNPNWASYIILQHDIHKESIDQVGSMIDFIRNKGFSIVPMHQCRGHQSAYQD